MTVTLEDIKTYLGVEEYDKYDSLLEGCLEDAAVLVNQYVGAATVPDTILDRCHLVVAVDLWERRNAPNGIANQQYATADGVGAAPMRIARDPLASVYPMLRRWVSPW